MLAALLLLIACDKAPVPETGAPGTTTPGETDPVDSEDTVDTYDITDTVDTSETSDTEPVVEDPPVDIVPPIPESESDWLFGADQVHAIDLALSEASIEALWADPFTYVPGTVTVDGLVFDEVGVRLKGQMNSFRELDEKAGFKIKLDEYDDGLHLNGLRKLTLNNAINDPSYLREHLAYLAFRAVDLPASRAGYAWVTLNGEPYGLYVNVESVDLAYLGRQLDDPTGNLYDGKYLWDGAFSATRLDFTADLYALYELEEGHEVDHVDLYDVVVAIEKNAFRPDWLEGTGEVVDWDRLLPMFAVEHWVNQLDGYALNINNVRVYFDPLVGGRAMMIPWDLDNTFRDEADWGLSWDAPRGLLADYCVLDELCGSAWAAAADQTADAIDAADLASALAQRQALIAPFVELDERDWTDPETVHAEAAELQRWVNERSGEVRGHWGL